MKERLGIKRDGQIVEYAPFLTHHTQHQEGSNYVRIIHLEVICTPSMEKHSQKPKVKGGVTLEECEATGAHSNSNIKHSPITTQTLINPHPKVHLPRVLLPNTTSPAFNINKKITNHAKMRQNLHLKEWRKHRLNQAQIRPRFQVIRKL